MYQEVALVTHLTDKVETKTTTEAQVIGGEGDKAMLVFAYVQASETKGSTSSAWLMTLGWTYNLLLAIY
jgi:hypothetical protein